MLDTLLHPPLTIRDLNQDDIPAVSAMAECIWRKHYVPDIVTAEQIDYMLPRLCSVDAIRSAIQERNQRFWLLFSKEQLVGYAAVEPMGPHGWFIDKLYVDQDEQRRGLGSALMQHILVALQPRELVLRVNRKNYSAINFYFKHGFMIERVDCKDIGHGYVMDDFIMRRTA